MASLRFMSFPSTTDLQTHFSTLLHKPSNTLSFSSNPSHPHIRTTIHRPLVLNFSASTAQFQEQTLNSKPDVPRKVSLDRIVIKGLPWEATAEDIRSLAEPYGVVLDVEVSMHNKTHNRGLAFVTFSTAEEAQRALNNIKEIDGRPLILNYAYQRPEKKLYVPPRRTFNLFVANLPFNAEEKDLKEFFEAEYNSVHSVKLVYLKNPRRSAGYGFVGFKTKKHADAAIAAFNGKLFMGRRLDIKRSDEFVKDRKKEDSVQNDKVKSNAEQVETSTAEEN